ncbi:RNA-binding ATPase activator ESF2 [Aspergillus saccharolyticus JOP 1030-1]|uniref:Pre-rRNA-processing protein ESF2 n=1 Tax=Aspergillus saccharolyticus JOP 1030-1 TaxID=1450539 RepID=A0A318Z538_9EURO|nr:hypothetical protein BP01DRAFT_360216 [Aspergillus saccharolyticus JOP 1030-1]PYH41564.1 hypothetical protein BP01DRAFT_360216 [Aspergillus saccharolyticus JOP 1030-1]
MTSRKRNDPFDLGVSDDSDEDKGYDSAADEEKGKGPRSAKRRRVVNDLHGLESEDEDYESGSDSEGEGVKGKGKTSSAAGSRRRAQPTTSDDEEEEEEEHATASAAAASTTRTASATAAATSAPTKKQTTTKPILKKDKKNKTGVIYLSSLPPHLKPFALKNIIESRGFGPITRVFLTPETKKRHATNKRRKAYADGWLEFASKKTAKICAETLNGNIIGGKKGGFYHDDILNLKYLKGFKWNDLQEQISRERSEREARQRAEDSKARKEDKVFLEGVERGKVLDGIRKKNEEKERRKLVKSDDGAKVEGAAAEQTKKHDDLKIRRVFRQNEVKMGRDKSTEEFQDLGADTKRVLGKIF